MAMPIKHVLRFYIAKEQILLKELSKRLGITNSYISKIMKGERDGSTYLKDRIVLLVRASEKLTNDEKKRLEAFMFKDLSEEEKSHAKI